MRPPHRTAQFDARIYTNGNGQAVLAQLCVDGSQLSVAPEGSAQRVNVPLSDCDMKLGGNDDRAVFVWRTTGDTIVTELGVLDDLVAGGLAPEHIKKEAKRAKSTSPAKLARRAVTFGVVGIILLKVCGFGLAIVRGFEHISAVEKTSQTQSAAEKTWYNGDQQDATADSAQSDAGEQTDAAAQTDSANDSSSSKQ